MISLKSEIEKVREEERYYTESGKLCPYPDMSDEDLSDFEKWEFVEFGRKPLYNWDWWKRIIRTREVKGSFQQTI